MGRKKHNTRRGYKGLLSGHVRAVFGVICVQTSVRVCVVRDREFEGSVVNPCVMLALALLCRGHPLSFVMGLLRPERMSSRVPSSSSY